MKLTVSALAVVSALGTLPLVLTDPADGNAAAGGPREDGFARYALSVSGQDGECTVRKGTGRRAELKLDAGCVAMMPRLAEARYWQENAAGEVLFVTADGRPVVEFFAADGVAYELLNPVSPLMALSVR